MWRIRPLVDRKAGGLQCETEFRMKRSESGLRAPAPSQVMPVRRKDPISSRVSTKAGALMLLPRRCSAGMRSAGCSPRNASVRWILSVRRCPAAGRARYLAGKRSDRRAARCAGPYGEEEPLRLARRGIVHAGTIKQRRGSLAAAPARIGELVAYPFATESSAFGLSKNCSSSVEPLSAVVEDCPPWIVCVTASK